jgi:hypothetical protein
MFFRIILLRMENGKLSVALISSISFIVNKRGSSIFFFRYKLPSDSSAFLYQKKMLIIPTAKKTNIPMIIVLNNLIRVFLTSIILQHQNKNNAVKVK